MSKLPSLVLLAVLSSSCASIHSLTNHEAVSLESSSANDETSITVEEVDTAQSNDAEPEAEAEAFEVEGTRDVYTDKEEIRDDNIALDYQADHYKFWVNYFTKKDRDRFARHLNNGYKYKQLVFHILKEHGLPTDLFYVGLIESGYNSRIHSHAGAAGPWQFMPKTARHYGLRVDHQVDERWNIYKSTHAAARYFSDLYNIFGSWELAMCAYNAGEYRIIGAIRRGKTRDYRELVRKKLIPKETIYYIPKVAAARHLVQNEKSYGFFHTENEDSVYATAALVELNQSFSLQTVAKMASVPMSVVKDMNPDIKGDSVRVRGAYGLLMPKIHASKVAALDLPKLRVPAQYESASSHKVRRGENLSVIARRYGLSVAAIKHENGLSSARIYVGQRLKLPSSVRAVASEQKLVTHKVAKGENLTLIAKRYGVSITELRRMNRLRGSRIFPGQKLQVRGVTVTIYRVRSGDNLIKIAKRFGVSVSELRRTNGLANNIIYPNQKLSIPSEG